MAANEQPAPYSDEDEALAESLADAVVEKYQRTIPAEDLEEMREYLVISLLATPEGRRKLAAARLYPEKTVSDEVDRFGIDAMIAERKKGQTA